MLQEIGSIVKYHRKKAGLTQLELASLAGVGKAAIWDLENQAKSTRLDTLAKILQVLNIRVRWESPLMQAFEAMNEKS